MRIEPRPGDLLVHADDVDVNVEVFAMRSAAGLESQEELSRQMFEVADDISRRHGVHLTGQLPGIDTDIAAWGRWLEQPAADVARIGIALTARWDDPASAAAGNTRADSTTRPGVAAASAFNEVTVAPGSAPTGAELVGPNVELDTGSRIRAHAKRKARQVAGAPAAWLWVENHGPVDLLAPIASAPLIGAARRVRRAALRWCR
ncbi:hypothetical protein [Pimelobacter simplex]|uniref:hypothetical protein n=1 Tax=Nocardioides simplex TaxID=2045 RepID=UPI003AAA5075